MTSNRELPGSCCCCTCGYYISPILDIYLPAGLFYSFSFSIHFYKRGRRRKKVQGGGGENEWEATQYTHRELKNKSNIKETRGQARLLRSSVQGNGWSRMEEKIYFLYWKGAGMHQDLFFIIIFQSMAGPPPTLNISN